MIVVLDTSTLINLDNGEVLAIVLSLPNHSFQVSPEVRREASTVVDKIEKAVARGDIDWVDDMAIDAASFGGALSRWGLGPGETECILAATALRCVIACDDRAARRVIKRELGVSRMTGTVGLLRDAVTARLLTAKAAFIVYQNMRYLGGFLPVLTLNDFKP